MRTLAGRFIPIFALTALIALSVFAGTAKSRVESACDLKAVVPFVSTMYHDSASEGHVDCSFFGGLTFSYDLENRTHFDTILDMQSPAATYIVAA